MQGGAHTRIRCLVCAGEKVLDSKRVDKLLKDNMKLQVGAG